MIHTFGVNIGDPVLYVQYLNTTIFHVVLQCFL